ncbi:MAG: serine kinase [Armatimonadia bacterium]
MAEAGVVTIADVVRELGLTVIAGSERLVRGVTGVQVCDLLSHVMARGQAGQLWITIQVHPNVVAVAALGGMAAIVVADGLLPGEDTINHANDEGMPLLASGSSAFEVAGRLYAMGLR